MDEISLIKKYLKPLSKNSRGALNLEDDIFFDYKKRLAVSVDSYVLNIHFNSLEPKKFVKKILRASLSDLYCKGVVPKFYFLSFALNSKLFNHQWLSKVKKIFKSEQKKFNITLSGGDTVKSNKLIVTITVLGYSNENPVLRSGSKINDDIYVTGNIGDSYIGLNILKKKYTFGKLNNFFTKKYYEPDLPVKISHYLSKISSASIDISDGLGLDLKRLLSKKNFGAIIDLNSIPFSHFTKMLIANKKLKVKDIFSNGDDYQILFTSKKSNKKKINLLSKKLNIKITRIGHVTLKKNIIFIDKGKKIKLNGKKMGYIHNL